MIVDELVSLLGLEIDPKAAGTAEKFGAILGKVTGVAVKAGGALIGLATTVNAFAIAQAGAIDEAGKFADQINIGFERLQELEYAAVSSGGSVSALRGDLEKLSKSFGGTADPAEKLLRIADRMQGMSKRGQTAMADSLGISSETLKLIQQGRSGIEALSKRAHALGGVLDVVAKQRAAKFIEAFHDLKFVISGVSKTLAAELLPNITKATKSFTEWIVENKGWISLGIKQVVDGVSRAFDLVGTALGKVVGWLKQATGPLAKFVKDLDISQGVMILVAGALGVLAVAMIPVIAGFIAANIPIIAITAAIAAAILVIDDLYSYFNGGDSIIGEWIASFTAAYPAIASTIGKIWELIKSFAAFLAGAFGVAAGHLIEAFKIILPVIGTIIESAIDLIAGLFQVIDDLISGANPFEGLVKWFSEVGTKMIDMASKFASEIVSKIVGGIGSIGSSISGFFGGGVGATGATAAQVPAAALAGAGGATYNNSITQNINGAGDPRAVGNEAANRSGMGASLQQSNPGMYGPTIG